MFFLVIFPCLRTQREGFELQVVGGSTFKNSYEGQGSLQEYRAPRNHHMLEVFGCSHLKLVIP